MIPIITIDGPSGSGKTTLSYRLAKQLGWHLLNSGSLYRALAYEALVKQIDIQDVDALTALALSMDIEFVQPDRTDSINDQCVHVLSGGIDVSYALSTQDCASVASKIAALPEVRRVLLTKQKAFCRYPGLVAEGRDMGTVIFPEAPVKVFLQASAKVRAKRRKEQLKAAGISVNLDELCDKITERDIRDKAREVAPLIPAADARVIDTTALTADQVLNLVLKMAIDCWPDVQSSTT